MANQDNNRQLPSAAADSQPNSPDQQDNNSQLVPIFFENDYLRAYDRGDLSRFTTCYDPSASESSSPPNFPFQFPLPQIGRITMADRFPSIEDLDLGELTRGKYRFQF